MKKFLNVIVDQVKGGWNIELVRQNKDGFLRADRIARFGAEICSDEKDEDLAKEMAERCADLIKQKYGKKHENKKRIRKQ